MTIIYQANPDARLIAFDESLSHDVWSIMARAGEFIDDDKLVWKVSPLIDFEKLCERLSEVAS